MYKPIEIPPTNEKQLFENIELFYNFYKSTTELFQKVKSGNATAPELRNLADLLEKPLSLAQENPEEFYISRSKQFEQIYKAVSDSEKVNTK